MDDQELLGMLGYDLCEVGSGLISTLLNWGLSHSACGCHQLVMIVSLGVLLLTARNVEIFIRNRFFYH